jgi:hypothetical protein
MSIKISCEVKARLAAEARRLGISVDMLLKRLMAERPAPACTVKFDVSLPVWHLGGGALRRRDLYDDVR